MKTIKEITKGIEGPYCSDAEAMFSLCESAVCILEHIARLAERTKTAPRAVSVQSEGGWRPISEAPKDGRCVLLIHATNDGAAELGRVYMGYWSDSAKEYRDSFGNLARPTHFMPIPPPPKY